MLTIRKRVFETNSSSTHCLVVANDKLHTDYNEALFNKSYNIKELMQSVSGNDLKDMDGEAYYSIEEKLAYCCRIICMQRVYEDLEEDGVRSAGNSVVARFIRLLTEIFPNTDFSYLDKAPWEYAYEDGEYVLEEPWSWNDTPHEPEITPFLDKDVLTHLFQDGTIYFGNRDDEKFSDFIYYDIEKDAATTSMHVSG